MPVRLRPWLVVVAIVAFAFVWSPGAGPAEAAEAAPNCSAPAELRDVILCKFPYPSTSGVLLAEDWCYHSEGDRGYNWWPYVESGVLKFARIRYAVRIQMRYVSGVQLGSSIFIGFEFPGDNGSLPVRIQKPVADATPQAQPGACAMTRFVRDALRNGVEVGVPDLSKMTEDDADYRWWYFNGQAHSVKRILRIPAKFELFNAQGGTQVTSDGFIVVSYGGGAGP